MPDQGLMMAVSATLVVAVYGASVALRRGTALWYEWVMAALGVGFALWFWAQEWRRYQRKKGRG